MVETSFDHAAAATSLATLVDTTRAQLTVSLPSSAVRPLYSTNDAGAIVDRGGATVREPVKRRAPQSGVTR